MALGSDGTLVLLSLEPTGRSGDVPVVLDAVERALAGGPTSVRVIVLVPDADARATADDVRGRGLGLALAVDDREADRFAFAHGDGFAGPVEELAPDLCAVRVRWHPDDDPDVKKAQALGLTKLAAWLHETDRALLLELVVPPTAADLANVGGDVARYERDHRPAQVLDVVREIRDLGTEADLWSVPAGADAASFAALDELVRDEGRDRVGFLVRLDTDGAAAGSHTAAAFAAYRGVSLSAAAWSDELAAVDAGERSRDEVVRTIGEQLAATIERASAGSPA